MKDQILNRINTINTSYRKIREDDRIKRDLSENKIDMLYKHIYRYSAIDWQKHDGVDYAILSGVWQEYIVQKYLRDTNILKAIEPTKRSGNKKIFEKDRKSSAKKIPEKVQCRELKECAAETALGKILDFQVPLKADRADCKGELDLVAKVNKNTIRIIEYKVPNSDEPLLRAVLEAITYYRQINGANVNESEYLIDFNNVFEEQCNIIDIAIVVPDHAYLFGHSKAYELIKEYNIACFKFSDMNDYKSIVEVSDSELDKYQTDALKNMQCIIDNSEKIVSLINI